MMFSPPVILAGEASFRSRYHKSGVGCGVLIYRFSQWFSLLGGPSANTAFGNIVPRDVISARNLNVRTLILPCWGGRVFIVFLVCCYLFVLVFLVRTLDLYLFFAIIFLRSTSSPNVYTKFCFEPRFGGIIWCFARLEKTTRV
jgi:hypothetical protein